MKTLAQLQLDSKKVLLRLDLDVNLENGKVADATRIENSIPTVKEILAQKASIIIIGHLGRSQGQVISELSTKLLVPTFEKFLDRKVIQFDSIFSQEVKKSGF